MNSLRQVWAAAQGNPRNPKIAKRFIKKRESGSEASPDSANPSSNRREAKMEFGDDIPKRVWDWSHAPAVRDSA